MGVAQCAEIAAALLRGGLAPTTPAAAIQSAHTPRQRAHATTLAYLAADVRALGFAAPAILVVGQVAALGTFAATADFAERRAVG